MKLALCFLKETDERMQEKNANSCTKNQNKNENKNKLYNKYYKKQVHSSYKKCTSA